MSKQLKLFNGKGWGHRQYDSKGNQIYDETGIKFCDHAYICAHSVAEAVRIVNEATGKKIMSMYEINVYWNKECWGNSMDGIEPEVGVWTQQFYNDKPKRIWPK